LKIGKGTSTIQCNRGQFIMGRKTAAEYLGMPESTFYRNINKLKDFGYIDIESNKHYSVVTVINYDCCADNVPSSEQRKEHNKNNERTSNEQPKNTNNNYKNDKNKKNKKNKKLKVINISNYKNLNQNLRNEYLSIINLIDNELAFIKGNYKALNPAQFKILRNKVSYDYIKSKLVQMNSDAKNCTQDSLYLILKDTISANANEFGHLDNLEREAYEELISFIKEKLKRVASINSQLTFDGFQKLFIVYDWQDIKAKLCDLDEWEPLIKQKNVFSILNAFLTKDKNVMPLIKGEENSFIHIKVSRDFDNMLKDEKEKIRNEIDTYFENHKDDDSWGLMNKYPGDGVKKDIITELIEYNSLLLNTEYQFLNGLKPLTLKQFILNVEEYCGLDHLAGVVADFHKWVKVTNYQSFNDVLVNYSRKVFKEYENR